MFLLYSINTAVNDLNRPSKVIVSEEDNIAAAQLSEEDNTKLMSPTIPIKYHNIRVSDEDDTSGNDTTYLKLIPVGKTC